MKYLVKIGIGNLSKEKAEEYVKNSVKLFKESEFFNENQKVVYQPIRNWEDLEIIAIPEDEYQKPSKNECDCGCGCK